MCGTPHLSRTTRTGAVSPSSVSVPDTCGMSGAVAAGVFRHAANGAASPTTTKSAAPRTTLDRMAIRDMLLTEFDHEMGTTRKLLDRVPDDRLAWKPHQKSTALGDLATHLANIPTWAGR